MAAPVGVTRSPPMPSSCHGYPVSSAAVAGVGTGSIRAACGPVRRPAAARTPTSGAWRARPRCSPRRRDPSANPSRASSWKCTSSIVRAVHARFRFRERGQQRQCHARGRIPGSDCFLGDVLREACGSGTVSAAPRLAPDWDLARIWNTRRVRATAGAAPKRSARRPAPSCLRSKPAAVRRRGVRAARFGKTGGARPGSASIMRRDEHVAGNAAHEIEMDRESGRRSGRSASSADDGDDIGTLRESPRRFRIVRDRASAAARAASTDCDRVHAGEPSLVGIEAGGEELDVPARIDFSCISVCHSSTSANCLASSVRRKASGPRAQRRCCASRNSGEPRPSEHADATMSTSARRRGCRAA